MKRVHTVQSVKLLVQGCNCYFCTWMHKLLFDKNVISYVWIYLDYNVRISVSWKNYYR